MACGIPSIKTPDERARSHFECGFNQALQNRLRVAPLLLLLVEKHDDLIEGGTVAKF